MRGERRVTRWASSREQWENLYSLESSQLAFTANSAQQNDASVGRWKDSMSLQTAVSFASQLECSNPHSTVKLSFWQIITLTREIRPCSDPAYLHTQTQSTNTKTQEHTHTNINTQSQARSVTLRLCWVNQLTTDTNSEMKPVMQSVILCVCVCVCVCCWHVSY